MSSENLNEIPVANQEDKPTVNPVVEGKTAPEEVPVVEDKTNKTDETYVADAAENPEDAAEVPALQPITDRSEERRKIQEQFDIFMPPKMREEYALAQEYSRIFGIPIMDAKFVLPALNAKFFNEEKITNAEALRRLQEMPESERQTLVGPERLEFAPADSQPVIRQSTVELPWERKPRPGEIPGVENNVLKRPGIFWDYVKNDFEQLKLSVDQRALPSDFAEHIVQDHRKLVKEQEKLRVKYLGADYQDSSFWSDVEKYGTVVALQRLNAKGALLIPHLGRYLLEFKFLGAGGAVALEAIHAGATHERDLLSQGVDPQTAKKSGATMTGITALTLLAFQTLGKLFFGGQKAATLEISQAGGAKAVALKVGNQLYKGTSGTLLKDAPVAVRQFAGNVIKGGFINYLARLTGFVGSNAMASAGGQLIQNAVDVTLGLLPKDQIHKNVDTQALQGGVWAAASGLFMAGERYQAGKNLKSLTEGVTFEKITPRMEKPFDTAVRRNGAQWLLEYRAEAGDTRPIGPIRPNTPTGTAGSMPPATANAGGAEVAKPSAETSGNALERWGAQIMRGETPDALPPEVAREAGSNGNPAEYLLDADPRAAADFMEQNILAKAVGLGDTLDRLRLIEAQQESGVLENTSPEKLVEKLNEPLNAIERAQLLFADRNGVLTHNPAETRRALELVQQQFPHLEIYALTDAGAFPPEIRAQVVGNQSPDDIAAAWHKGKIYVNTAKLRPSEVARVIGKHEICAHDGLRRVLTPEQMTEFFARVRAGAAEELEAFARLSGYDPESDRGVEEFWAYRAEFAGNDPLKLFADNPEIAEFARDHGINTSTDLGKIAAARKYFDETGAELPKAPWYEKIIAWLRDVLRQLKVFRLANFTDADFRRMFRRAAKAENARRAMKGAGGESRFALDPKILTNHVPETVIDFPSADVQNAKIVTKILEKYIGTRVIIKSDGRIAIFSKENNRASLKRHRDSRIASESLDKVIKAAYPVGWLVGDMQKKHATTLGQYIYATAFCVVDVNKTKTYYTARIALDGKGIENEGVFKDIAIKNEGGTYVGLSLHNGSPYRRTPSPTPTIRELIEKIKSDCKKNYGKYFIENIPETIDRQRDLLYERAVVENPDYARSMIQRAAKRNGYVSDSETNFRDGHGAPGDMGFDFEHGTVDEYLDDGSDTNLARIAEGYNPQPDDYFDDPRGYGYDDREGLEAQYNLKQAIQKLKAGNPDATITVYRAVPNDVHASRLQNGDWVSPSRSYAVNHGEQRFGEGEYRIIEETIPAKFLWWDGNDIREWGYDNGESDFVANAVGNRKLDKITYDDQGKLIPLSKRFDRGNSDTRFSVEWVGEDQVLSEYDQFSDTARKALVDAAEKWAAGHYHSAKSPEEYLKFFQDNQLPVKSVDAARRIMLEAYRQFDSKRRAAGRRKAIDAYREKNLLFDFVIEQTNLINPGRRFEGEDGLNSSFFDPDYNKYSALRRQGPKESDASYRRYTQRRLDKLAHVSGSAIDELASMFVATYGPNMYGDELSVEQAIYDLFKNLTYKKIYSEYAKEKRDAEEYEQELVRQYRREQEAYYAEEMRKLAQQIIHNREWRRSRWVTEGGGQIKELYQLLTGKKPPKEPLGVKELDEMELAALAQKDSGATFADMYSRIREILGRRQDEKLAELFRKIREDRENDKQLEYAAKEELFRSVPKGLREKFMARIMGLSKFSSRPTEKYPDGTRYAKFVELVEDMIAFGQEARRQINLEALRTRLGQLHLQVDPTRKLVGRRDKSIQEEIDEIFDVAELPAEQVNTRIEELQAQLDAIEGDDINLAARIANLAAFGNLAGKNADELWNARKLLEDIAATGRNRLLDKIEARRAQDQADVDFIVKHVTGGKGVFDQQAKEADAAKEKSWWQNFRESASVYSALKLEDLLYLMGTNNTSTDWMLTPPGLIFNWIHNSNNWKNTSLREYGEFRAEMFGRFLGKERANLVEAAGAIEELRTRDKNPGVMRYYPTPETREIGAYDFTVEQARAMLFAAGKEGESVSGVTIGNERVTLNEFQTAILRQRLETRDARISRSYRRPELDGSTEVVLRAMDEREAKSRHEIVSVPTVKFTGARVPIEGGLTQLEALYYHLMWQQSDQRYKLYFNGFTPETMQEIDNFLRPETKRLGQDMVDYLERQGVSMRKLTEILYYAAMHYVEKYFPAQYVIAEKSQSIGANRGELSDPKTMQQAPGLVPGSIKMRTAHLREIAKCDALTVFENSVLRNTHFLAFGEVARKMRAVLLDPQVKQALDQTFGPKFFPALKSAVTDTINGGKLGVNRYTWFDKLFGNSVAVRMMFNLLSGMKQTVSWIANMQDVPASAVFGGLARGLTHPVEMVKTLSQTPYVKNRFEGGSDMWMKMILDRTSVSASKWNAGVAMVKNFGSLYTRFGDMTAVMLGGYGVYRYHYRRMIDRGFSEAEAKAYALKRFELTAESLQQSSAVHNRNAIQRSGAKFLTAWKSSQILQAQRILREGIALAKFGNRLGLKKDVKSYEQYLDQQIAEGKMAKLTPAERKAMLKFYKDFPLGKEIITPFKEAVYFLPEDDFAVNSYIQHFAVIRKETGEKNDDGTPVKIEAYSNDYHRLWGTLEKALKNPDDRLLEISLSGTPSIIYIAKQSEAKRGNHVVVCHIAMDGRILSWTHTDSKDKYIETLREREKAAFERYGVEDANGNRLYLTYDEYLKKKKDIPLYLATAEANQPGNPQGEPTDRINNLSPENENANKNSHNFYAGAELGGSRWGNIGTSLFVVATIAAAISGIGYLWNSAKKRKKLSVEDYSTEAMISAINDAVSIIPAAADIADPLLRRAIEGKKRFGFNDKTMAIGDTVGALDAAFFDIGKHISDQQWEKVADDAAKILMAAGALRPEFQVGGSAIYRGNEMYKLVSGADKPKKKIKIPDYGKQRRERRNRRKWR